jgi:hypothetical protein
MNRRSFLLGFSLLAAGCRVAPRSGERRAPHDGMAPRVDGSPSTPPSPSTSATPPEPTRLAEYRAHIAGIEKRLPEGFSWLLEPPFVVIGDGGKERLARHAEGTVRWAVRMLKQDFFSRDPERILDIWLFEGDESYRRHTRELFGHDPDTPYGYYSRAIGALVMNIATGGGTLVHEIVHPYIEANFPACPAWFNEGLGSLYEQSSSRNDRIVGLTNWRLAGLQRAIARQRLPSFAELTRMSDDTFYQDDRGTNYAQSRYLLYYLQEHGLLVDYYRSFVAAQRRDPGGYATLQKMLGTDDMKAFQQRWEAYVLALRFPG